MFARMSVSAFGFCADVLELEVRSPANKMVEAMNTGRWLVGRAGADVAGVDEGRR